MNPWGDDTDPGDYSSPDVHDTRQDNGPYTALQNYPLPTRFQDAPFPNASAWQPHSSAPQLDGQDRGVFWQRAAPDPNAPHFAREAGPEQPIQIYDDSQPPNTWDTLPHGAQQLPNYVPQWDMGVQPLPVDNDSLPYQAGGNDNQYWAGWGPK